MQQHMSRMLVIAAAAIAAASLAARSANAELLDSRPITVVIPFTPGASSDTFQRLVAKRVTESTNGFRAFRTALLRDPRIDWRQPWLDRYELEPYLLLKTIRLGYRHTEVPVTKIYPPREIGYTKMRPFVDWWSIIRPIVYVGLGLRT